LFERKTKNLNVKIFTQSLRCSVISNGQLSRKVYCERKVWLERRF